MKITDCIFPQGSWVLVEYIENDRTAGGVLIPEQAREQEWELEVMAVGKEVTDVKPGDFIVLEMGARLQSFERLGKKWAMVRDQFISMKVNPEYRKIEKDLKSSKPSPIILSSSNLKTVN